MLGVIMKAVAFESYPEINEFVKKLVIFFVINLQIFIVRKTFTVGINTKKPAKKNG